MTAAESDMTWLAALFRALARGEVVTRWDDECHRMAVFHAGGMAYHVAHSDLADIPERTRLELAELWERNRADRDASLVVNRTPDAIGAYYRWRDPEAPDVRRFEANAKWLAQAAGSIEEAAVADALACDWPGLDDEE